MCRSVSLVALLGFAGISLVAGLLGGCRGCNDGRAGNASPAPAPDAPDASSVPMAPPAPASALAHAPERLRLARGQTAGEWVELQVAAPDDLPTRTRFERWRPDDRFLSFDAMALLHDAFARASAPAAFDLFLPRLLDGPALRRLQTYLDSLDKELEATPDLPGARARWGTASSIVAGLPDEPAWLGARAALRGTIRELSGYCAELAKRGDRLWVLGI